MKTYVILQAVDTWLTFLSEGSDNEKQVKEPKKKPSQPAAPAPVFIKKKNATLAQQIEILNWHHINGKNQSATAKHFDPIHPHLWIKQPLVLSWLKFEAEWRGQWMQADKKCDQNAKQAQQTEHPEVSEMMDFWVSKAILLLTRKVLCQK
jgi:hypothetical protein